MKLYLALTAYLLLSLTPQASIMLVSEYGTGNVRAFEPDTGNEITLPAHYAPVGGNASGADGMVLDDQGRLYINRGDGTISRRSLDGDSFSVFADLEALYLLDLDRNDTHLFATQYGENTLFQVALSDGAITTISGPFASVRFDGVRVGPDGQVYVVDSSNGAIYAHHPNSSTWFVFLEADHAGDASQLEFGADGRVFLSRTISGQARIYSYTLNTPGDYASGLDASSQTLIGTYGSSGAATGIRIGPDGRLYANAFNAGEVWRSNVGITAMEASAFVTGLSEPGSIFFEQVSGPNQAPMASEVIIVGASAGGRTAQVHYVYADAEGDPEGDTIISWQFAEPPFTPPFFEIFGTNRQQELTYNPGDWHVRAAVTPIAQSGTLTGTVAYSEWLGPIAPADATTVYHIGNSFTRWGHIPLQLQNLAADAGFSHVYGEQLRDGEGLAYHWANGLADGVWTRGTPSRLELETGSWDWLVLQPMSREWTPSNLPDLLDYAHRFASLADSNGTRVVLYQYWNYEDENIAVQEDINTAFNTVRHALSTNGIDAIMLPAGEAFYAAVDEIPTLSRPALYQDNIHPSDEGYYLSALMHFAVLYRQSPAGLTNGAISAAWDDDTPVLIDPDLAAALQEVVWDLGRYHPHTGITAGRFVSWAASLPAGECGLTDTPFEDGIANIVRWAFGIPQTSGVELDRLPTGSSVGPSLTFTIGADAEDAGARLIEEWSLDLMTGSWTNQPPAGVVRTRNNDEVTWTLDGPWTTLYYRAHIQLPTE